MSKGYRWTTLAFVAVVVLGGVPFKLISGSRERRARSAVTAQPHLGATAQIEAAADAVRASTAEVTTVTDQAAGEEQVRSGELDVAGHSGDRRRSTSSSRTSSRRVAGADVRRPGPAAGARRRPSTRPRRGPRPRSPRRSRRGARRSPPWSPLRRCDGGQIAAGYIAGILLFIALMTAGQLVAQGVVEEKSSRVVELLLATSAPWQLMAGKVLGIGLMGLLQMVLVVGAGVGIGVRPRPRARPPASTSARPRSGR